MCTPINRRSFLKSTVVGAGSTLAFTQMPTWARADGVEQDPHFYLQVIFTGGIDPSYTFDARPLEMTQSKLQVNYLGEEPKPWQGSNGVSTLTTSLVDPLKPHFDRFSVLNGVLMLTNFDGHQENSSYMLTGNAFGGDSYIPFLNEQKYPSALDFLLMGSLPTPNISNQNNGVPMTPQSASNFVKSLGNLASLDPSSRLFRHLSSRFDQASRGRGKVSRGSRLMANSLNKIPSLAEQFKSVHVDTTLDKNLTQQMQLVGEFFKNRLAASAVISYSGSLNNINVDCHDGKSAKDHPTALKSYMQDLADIFAYLRNTPFDGQKSLLDVTTIVVSSEFGRTMRGYGDFATSGTDHNPLRNSVIIGGKGIKPGMIVGATDYQSSSETLSQAHLSLDAGKKRIMSAPFDHATLKTVDAKPETYKADEYLNYMSVINSLYQSFGIKKERYLPVERNGTAAPVLSGLLV